MDTDEESNEDEKMESDDYKQVSFSPEVEVLEIEPRRQLTINAKKMNRLKGLRTDGIKNRLGDIKINRSLNTSNINLHSIKKTISMKPAKTSPARISKMKSDLSPVSIKARLGTNHMQNRVNMNSKNNGSDVFKRLGRKNI